MGSTASSTAGCALRGDAGARWMAGLVALLLAAGLAGCGGRSPVGPPELPDRFQVLRPLGVRQVDLLFVVSAAHQMADEVEILRDQSVVLLQELIDPTVDPGSGERHLAVEDLHVGLLWADPRTGWALAGTSLYREWGGCQARYDAPGCDREACPWLVHSAEHPNDGSTPDDPPIWTDLWCLLAFDFNDPGPGGPPMLEASIAALTGASEPGGPNHGFLREGSLLVVVYYVEDDDCSTSDPQFFDPGRDDLGPVWLRCLVHEEGLHPVARYDDALRALRRGDEAMLLVAAFAGIPIDGSWEPGDPVSELWDLRGPSPRDPYIPIYTCETSLGNSTSPARLVELVYGFGEQGFLASICRTDQTGALRGLARAIGRRLRDDCLSEPPPREARERCVVLETLEDDAPCPHPAEPAGAVEDRRAGWHRDRNLEADGRRRCEVLPRGASAPGWEVLPDSEADPSARRCPNGRLALDGVALVGDRVRFGCRDGT